MLKKQIIKTVCYTTVSTSLLLAGCDSAGLEGETSAVVTIEDGTITITPVEGDATAETPTDDSDDGAVTSTPVEDDAAGDTPADDSDVGTITITPVEDDASAETPTDEGTNPFDPVVDDNSAETPTEDGTTAPDPMEDDTTADGMAIVDPTDSETITETPTEVEVTPVDPIQSVSLLANGTFEDGLAEWRQVEPAFESGITFEGIGAVKLEESGSVTQTVELQPDTLYVVTAYVQGPASIGVIVGGETFTSSGSAVSSADIDNEAYTLVAFEFDSLEEVSADIFAVGNAGTSRVDDFGVYVKGTEPVPFEPDMDTDTDTTPEPDSVTDTDAIFGDDIVANGTFEDGLTGWEQVEPAFESGDSFDGLGAVKLEDFGSVTQSLVLQSNTRYVVSAEIEGTATIGIVVGGETFTATGTSEDYASVSFEFDSLEAVNSNVFAQADNETSRVDNLAVKSISESSGTGTESVTDSGTEDGTATGENVLANGGFENGLDGWDQIEPAAESGDSFEGVGSAKLEDGGSISQLVSVEPQSSYRVSGQIEGPGTIGANISDERFIASGTSDDFELVSFDVETGDAQTVTVFAETVAGTDTARIDNLQLQKIGSNEGDSAPEATTNSLDLPAVPADATNIVFNGTFENAFSGWNQTEPAQGSGVTHTGTNAGKLFESGSIAQNIFLVPQSRYLITAWLQGTATLSITVDGETTSVTGTGEEDGSYVPVDIEFESGSADTGRVLIQSTSSAAITRVDDVEVYKISLNESQSEPVDPNSVFDFAIWEVEGEVPVSRDGNLVFRALEQCVITPNGNGCRHEQKVKVDERYGLTDQYERFAASIEVTLSPSSETIVAQHHPEETGTLSALYLSDRNEAFPGVENGVASDGIFDVYATVRIPGSLENEVVVFGTVENGEVFEYEVINDHGVITSTALGKTFTLTSADSSSSYFKFGNYLQARDPVTGERLDLPKPHTPDARAKFLEYYQALGITESFVTFRTVEYERVIDADVQR